MKGLIRNERKRVGAVPGAGFRIARATLPDERPPVVRHRITYDRVPRESVSKQPPFVALRARADAFGIRTSTDAVALLIHHSL